MCLITPPNGINAYVIREIAQGTLLVAIFGEIFPFFGVLIIPVAFLITFKI